MIKKTLEITLVISKLKTVLGGNCAKIPVLTLIQIKTIIASWIICKGLVPLESVYIAAIEPKQLWPIIANVADAK